MSIIDGYLVTSPGYWVIPLECTEEPDNSNENNFIFL